MRIPARAGITLIEILIAVSLLSLLTVAALFAMRMGLSTMEKTDDHLVRNRRVANARKIIENEIQGFTLAQAEWRPRPETVLAVPFVEWRPDGMRFVTRYSLRDAWRGYPQMAEMQVIPGDKGEGVRLIVNETQYTGPAQTGQRLIAVDPVALFTPVIPGPSSFVLADKLTYCRFYYLEQIPIEPYRTWRPDWIAPGTLPLGIRIDMQPLNPKPGELQSRSVTVQLNAQPEGAGYQDVF